MGVESRDLVDLGHGEAHLRRERRQVTRGKAAVTVLDPVQMLDQQIATPGLVAQQRTNFLLRRRHDLPALFGIAGLAPPPAWMSGSLIAA